MSRVKRRETRKDRTMAIPPILGIFFPPEFLSLNLSKILYLRVDFTRKREKKYERRQEITIAEIIPDISIRPKTLLQNPVLRQTHQSQILFQRASSYNNGNLYEHQL